MCENKLNNLFSDDAEPLQITIEHEMTDKQFTFWETITKTYKMIEEAGVKDNVLMVRVKENEDE